MAGKPKNLRSEENLLLGRRLGLTRRAMGQTQRDFAAAAGVSPESYNQWEKGAVEPPPRSAKKLVRAHKLTLDWIYMAKTDCLPSWLTKAIEALAEAENAAFEAAEQKLDQEVKVVRPKRRGHKAA